jgi:hypothetical protein
MPQRIAAGKDPKSAAVPGLPSKVEGLTDYTGTSTSSNTPSASAAPDVPPSTISPVIRTAFTLRFTWVRPIFAVSSTAQAAGSAPRSVYRTLPAASQAALDQSCQLWGPTLHWIRAASRHERGDTFYLVGCLFRCAACLVQVLFALKRYFVNVNGSVKAMDPFLLRAEDFGKTVGSVLAHADVNPEQLSTRFVTSTPCSEP